MPIGAPEYNPDPKSGWSPVPRPMPLIRALELVSTGAVEMSVFHALLIGKGIAPFKLAPAPRSAAFMFP